VAFFHKRSHTVLITDTIVSVPAEPPAIVQLDPYPLLYHAKDQAFDMIADTPANRLKGWQRVTLFALYFSPSVLEVPTWSQVWRDAKKAPERSRKAYFGFFLSNGGKIGKIHLIFYEEMGGYLLPQFYKV
jgi:hypothetical protein